MDFSLSFTVLRLISRLSLLVQTAEKRCIVALYKYEDAPVLTPLMLELREEFIVERRIA